MVGGSGLRQRCRSASDRSRRRMLAGRGPARLQTRPRRRQVNKRTPPDQEHDETRPGGFQAARPQQNRSAQAASGLPSWSIPAAPIRTCH